MTRSRKVLLDGHHERAVQSKLEELLSPGDVVWDVGAHIGFLSLLSARLVGPGGRVLAFEPMAMNRARLVSSIESNGTPNVEVDERALGAKSGDRVLYIGDASATWTLRADRGAKKGLPAYCTTLDEVAASNLAPALIKIDVEGAEVDVLRGGAQLLADHRPKLLVEFHGAWLLEQALKTLPRYVVQQVDSDHWVFT